MIADAFLAVGLVAWVLFWPGVAAAVWLGRVTAAEGLLFVIGLPFVFVLLGVISVVSLVGHALEIISAVLGCLVDRALNSISWFYKLLKRMAWP
jgi:hypothetical protein